MTDEGPAAEHTHGHHWKDAGRVADFAARMDAREVERAQQFALLGRLLPFADDAAFRILDLGAGYGAVTAALLDRYASAEAVLLDVSEAMIDEGTRRLAPFAGRYRYVLDDFAAGRLPGALQGPYDAVVSSLAIHHLPPEGKRSLYGDIVAHLRPGGCFFNIDMVAADNADIAAVYEHVTARERAERGERPPSAHAHRSEFQPLRDHLAWLREAGLTRVDCYWRQLGTALFGGYLPREGADA